MLDTTIILFVTGAAALLSTPGPTNSVLAVAGAESGFYKSLPLLTAELCGYFLSIFVIREVIGPVLSEALLAKTALKVAMTVYLTMLAIKMWNAPKPDREGRFYNVGWVNVLWITLLNPKALIFALELIPPLAGVTSIYFVLLAVFVPSFGCAWILIGASFRGPFDKAIGNGVATKFGAGILFAFAVLLLTTTVAGVIGLLEH